MLYFLASFSCKNILTSEIPNIFQPKVEASVVQLHLKSIESCLVLKYRQHWPKSKLRSYSFDSYAASRHISTLRLSFRN